MVAQTCADLRTVAGHIDPVANIQRCGKCGQCLPFATLAENGQPIIMARPDSEGAQHRRIIFLPLQPANRNEVATRTTGAVPLLVRPDIGIVQNRIGYDMDAVWPDAHKRHDFLSHRNRQYGEMVDHPALYP